MKAKITFFFFRTKQIFRILWMLFTKEHRIFVYQDKKTIRLLSVDLDLKTTREFLGIVTKEIDYQKGLETEIDKLTE